MQKKEDELEVRMSKFKASSGRAWEQMKNGMSSAMKELSKSYEKAKAQFLVEKNRSSLIFSSQLPSRRSLGAEVLLIYDRFLESSPATAKWIESFPQRYGVASGEELKSVDAFPSHIKKIMGIAEKLVFTANEHCCSGRW